MTEAVRVLARHSAPVSDVLSDSGETTQRFGEVCRTASPVDEPMLGQEQQPDRSSGWRGLGRRAKRVLHRCRAMLGVPDLLGQLNGAVDSRLAGVEQQIRTLVAEQRAAFAETLRSELAGSNEQLRGLNETLRAELAGSHEQLGSLNQTLRAELAGIRAQLGGLSEGQAHLGPEAFREFQRELSTEMAFSLHDIAQRLIARRGGARIKKPLREQVAKLENIGEHLSRLANEQFETKNHLTEVGTNTESLLQNLTTIVSEIRNIAIHLDTSLHSRFNTIEYERLDGLYDQMHHLVAALLRVRADIEKDRAEQPPLPGERYAPAQCRGLELDLRHARAEFPGVFPMWAERLEEMRKACLETKVGNVAHTGDPRSEAFRSLVEIHATGRVLDVGCGIFGRPFYLSSYPASLISGLDPLEPSEPVDFEFVRGIQEYLPWPDGAFSTVISATALDHCLSLDRSLAQIRRVLCPGGRFLLWFDSQPGSPRFDPGALDFVPADRFHLFHFDAAWFEPILSHWFEVVEKIEMRGREFDRLMYCLRLRESDSVKQVVDLVH